MKHSIPSAFTCAACETNGTFNLTRIVREGTPICVRTDHRPHSVNPAALAGLLAADSVYYDYHKPTTVDRNAMREEEPLLCLCVFARVCVCKCLRDVFAILLIFFSILFYYYPGINSL